MSEKISVTIAKHIIERGANTTAITGGLASIKEKDKQKFEDKEGAYYTNNVSRGLAGISGLAALADNVVSPITPIAGKVSAWTGLASSGVAIENDKQ